MPRFVNHTQLRWGNSLQQIQQHPWFAGVVWERLHEYQAPYVPFLSSATDTSNFDDLGSDLSVAPPVAAADNGGVVSPPLSRSPFVGFTFRHEDWMVWHDIFIFLTFIFYRFTGHAVLWQHCGADGGIDPQHPCLGGLWRGHDIVDGFGRQHGGSLDLFFLETPNSRDSGRKK